MKINETELKFIDFFAGIGGFRSGLESLGMKCAGFCEIDKFAKKSYKLLYDTTDEWEGGDITQVKADDIPDADIWTFGFPCQDISTAGKRRGIKEGTRSGLFYEIMRLLNEKEKHKPEWLIIENVKNLLSIDSGEGFLNVLSEMDKMGYNAEWKVYNSKNHGVPQNRERIYIVGHLRDKGNPGKILYKAETAGQINSKTIKQIGNTKNTTRFDNNPQSGRIYSAAGVSPTLMTPTNSIPKILDNPKIKQVGNLYDSDKFGGGPLAGQVFNTSGISPTLLTSPPIKILEDNRIKKVGNIYDTTRFDGDPTDGKVYNPTGISPTILTKSTVVTKIITEDTTNTNNTNPAPAPTVGNILFNIKEKNFPENTQKYEVDSTGNLQQGYLLTYPVKIVNCTSQGYLEANNGDGIDLSFIGSNNRRGRVQPQISNSLTTGGKVGVITGIPYRIRRLTPKECWRLQGFTDDQFNRVDGHLSETQLYKQAGNSVTVNVVRHVGQCILDSINNSGAEDSTTE